MPIIHCYFEHGLELGETRCPLPVDQRLSMDEQIKWVTSNLGVRVVMIDTLHEFPSGSSFVSEDIVSPEGEGLVRAVNHLVHHQLPHKVYLMHLVELEYEMRGMLYHCTRLILQYATMYRNFVSEPPFPGKQPGPNARLNLPQTIATAYEFDAFLSKGRRVFDRLGRVLWDLFPGANECPSSFTRQIAPLRDSLPSDRAQILDQLWTNHGVTLREYRDAGHHRHLFHSVSKAYVRRRSDGGWAVVVPIPDNPKDGRRKLTYERELDALTYSWLTACELIKNITVLTKDSGDD